MRDDQKFKPTYGKGRGDFRSWWTGYAELTRHVAPELRALHLLTAVQDGVKLNCEAHFQPNRERKLYTVLLSTGVSPESIYSEITNHALPERSNIP